jgi:hypothetical protein
MKTSDLMCMKPGDTFDVLALMKLGGLDIGPTTFKLISLDGDTAGFEAFYVGVFIGKVFARGHADQTISWEWDN